ncbi:MAG: hypothetical protein R3D30_07700 [Hyphomicrobiales bacterium]
MGGADGLFGGEGNDLVDGGTGDDLLTGDDGTDTVSYVNLVSKGDRRRHRQSRHHRSPNTGAGSVDTISGFENILGTLSDDNLTGDAGANFLAGNNGRHAGQRQQQRSSCQAVVATTCSLADAAAGRLYGDSEQDMLNGGRSKDVLFGGADQDFFEFNSIRDSRPAASTTRSWISTARSRTASTCARSTP